MKRIVIALGFLGILLMAVRGMVPFSDAHSEIEDCLSLQPPLTIEELGSIYDGATIQSNEINGGRLFVLTPNDEYLYVANSPIITFIPHDGEEASWVRCTEGQFAFGGERPD